jgi:hypothetical protein
MLTRLKVSGFKNLVDVDVRFGLFVMNLAAHLMSEAYFIVLEINMMMKCLLKLK